MRRVGVCSNGEADEAIRSLAAVSTVVELNDLDRARKKYLDMKIGTDGGSGNLGGK